jgi:hypothetical protein
MGPFISPDICVATHMIKGKINKFLKITMENTSRLIYRKMD